jgi:hypothetical protein
LCLILLWISFRLSTYLTSHLVSPRAMSSVKWLRAKADRSEGRQGGIVESWVEGWPKMKKAQLKQVAPVIQ